MTLWAESRGEPFAGKVAVANVIRNRMKAQNKTAAEIVLHPYAFSCWMTVDVNRIPAATIDDTDAAVKECTDAWIASMNQNLVANATLYANMDALPNKPSWLDKANEVVKIGHHTFFEEVPA